MTARWYYARAKQKVGPISFEDLQQLVRSGQIGPLDMVWEEGTFKWRTASEVHGLLPPWFVSSHSLRKPWNPEAIAWLGVVFTPIWSGILAAMNSRRLGLSTPIARPIGCLVGWIAADWFVSVFYTSLWVEVALYLAAAWLIWEVELRHQMRAFEDHVAQGRPRAGWLVPHIAGTPLAVLTFVGFVIVPLQPLEPRDVCERFMRASTTEELKKYTTLRLWPQLAEFVKIKARKELGGESTAPPEYGGHDVEWRMLVDGADGQRHFEGIFYLIVAGDEWKIDEIFVTAVNSQPLQAWFPLSSIPANSNQPVAATIQKAGAWQAGNAKTDRRTSGEPYVQGLKLMGALLKGKGAKILIAVLVAFGAAAAAFARKLKREMKAGVA